MMAILVVLNQLWFVLLAPSNLGLKRNHSSSCESLEGGLKLTSGTTPILSIFCHWALDNVR